MSIRLPFGHRLRVFLAIDAFRQNSDTVVALEVTFMWIKLALDSVAGLLRAKRADDSKRQESLVSSSSDTLHAVLF
jgi:hypothetical protein